MLAGLNDRFPAVEGWIRQAQALLDPVRVVLAPSDDALTLSWSLQGEQQLTSVPLPLDLVRAGVRGEDDEGLLQAHALPAAVGEAALLEDLQQQVVHPRVRLLDLVEEHDGARVLGELLRELAAPQLPPDSQPLLASPRSRGL